MMTWILLSQNNHKLLKYEINGILSQLAIYLTHLKYITKLISKRENIKLDKLYEW